MRLLLLSALLLAACVLPRGGIGANDAEGAVVVVGVAAAVALTQPEPDEALCRDNDVDPPHTCPKQTR